jgi:hypothetical protein
VVHDRGAFYGLAHTTIRDHEPSRILVGRAAAFLAGSLSVARFTLAGWVEMVVRWRRLTVSAI